MDLFEAVATRRSVRKFTDRPLEEATLARILEAVRQSPSWANMQCWRLVVVRDEAARRALSELSNAPKGYKTNPAKGGLAAAPAVAVLCADPAESGDLGGQQYYMVDAGIAAQTLMLAARAEGLGTVFVGVFQEEQVRALLAIPPQIRVVGLFPLGHPAEEKKAGPPRKPLAETCFRERWGQG